LNGRNEVVSFFEYAKDWTILTVQQKYPPTLRGGVLSRPSSRFHPIWAAFGGCGIHRQLTAMLGPIHTIYHVSAVQNTTREYKYSQKQLKIQRRREEVVAFDCGLATLSCWPPSIKNTKKTTCLTRPNNFRIMPLLSLLPIGCGAERCCPTVRFSPT
jgi:hypothetical protein